MPQAWFNRENWEQGYGDHGNEWHNHFTHTSSRLWSMPEVEAAKAQVDNWQTRNCYRTSWVHVACPAGNKNHCISVWSIRCYLWWHQHPMPVLLLNASDWEGVLVVWGFPRQVFATCVLFLCLCIHRANCTCVIRSFYHPGNPSSFPTFFVEIMLHCDMWR